MSSVLARQRRLKQEARLKSINVRVDSEVYRHAMLGKHLLEMQTGGFVSMGDAIAFLLALCAKP